MGMNEGDMEMFNIHYLTMPKHVWIEGGHCRITIQLKKGFPPKLNFPQHRTNGGEGIGSSKSSYAASVPKPSTHPKTVNCSEHLVGKMAHSYSGGADI